MPQTLSAHGDLLEQAYAAFLSSRIPAYERLWAAFIGNDGESRLPHTPGLSSEWEVARVRVNQFSYTAVESAIVANRIAVRLQELTTRTAAAGQISVEDYLSVSEDVFSFYGHLGRARDMIGKLGTAIRMPDLADKLNEYYQQRNNVVHEARAPLILVDGLIAIVPPEGATPAPSAWQRDSLWSDAAQYVAQDLSPLIDETLNEFLALLDSALARAHSRLMATPLKQVAAHLSGDTQAPPPTQPSGSNQMPLFPSRSRSD